MDILSPLSRASAFKVICEKRVHSFRLLIFHGVKLGLASFSKQKIEPSAQTVIKLECRVQFRRCKTSLGHVLLQECPGKDFVPHDMRHGFGKNTRTTFLPPIATMAD